MMNPEQAARYAGQAGCVSPAICRPCSRARAQEHIRAARLADRSDRQAS